MPFLHPFVHALVLMVAMPASAATMLEGLVTPYRQVELCAPVASHIIDMKVVEGETVKAGQPLAQLYGRLEELEMKRTRALLERREFEAKGAKNLFDNKIIPEAKDLESRIDLELARLNYETASEQFKLRTILSPIDGTVVERRRDVGEAVSASQTVFRIMDLTRVIIVCSLKAENLAHVAPGQKLAVRVPGLAGTTTFQGEVVMVAPCADSTGHFRLKLVVDNADAALRPGLKAMVELPEN